jgi:DNA-binding LytR/AlgR family response regulator
MDVLIIEDEAPAFRRLQKLLEETGESIVILDVIDTVKDSISWLKNHQSPDLIFSDIQLADGLSFEIFEAFEVSCPVIFTTAFDEYMLRAFEVNSIDYLLKPVNAENLERSIRKFKKLQTRQPTFQGEQLTELLQSLKQPEIKYKDRFLVKLGDRLISIGEQNIAYFVIQDGLVYLQCHSEKKYTMDQTLDELEKVLDPSSFFRLNRQMIAHLSAIQTAHQYFNGKLKIDLEPKFKEEIIVSREKAGAFKSWLDGN